MVYMGMLKCAYAALEEGVFPEKISAGAEGKTVERDWLPVKKELAFELPALK